MLNEDQRYEACMCNVIILYPTYPKTLMNRGLLETFKIFTDPELLFQGLNMNEALPVARALQHCSLTNPMALEEGNLEKKLV